MEERKLYNEIVIVLAYIYLLIFFYSNRPTGNTFKTFDVETYYLRYM
jgi:hypothetical protein